MPVLKLARNVAIAAALALLVVAITVAAPAAEWALTGALNTHDPSITKEGKTWWVFQTSSVGIGVKSSPDGRAWTKNTPIFPNGLPWWHAYNNNTNGTWAADVHDWNGRAICYYAVSTFGSNHSAIGLMTASGIAKSDWADQGPVLTSSHGSNYNAIDPTFTLDASGHPWLAFGSWWTGIYLTRLDPGSLKPVGPWSHLAAADGGIEGPSLIYHDSYYYLFVSRGTCCAAAASTYHICYGRSRGITGPYFDQAGVNLLDGGGSVLEANDGGRYIAPGGQSISDGVIAWHALDNQTGYHSRLFISDLYFSKGWPTLEQESPNSEPTPTLPRRKGEDKRAEHPIPAFPLEKP